MTPPIRPQDIVRLRYTPSGYPSWIGYVGAIRDGRAFIQCGYVPRGDLPPESQWIPVGLLDLVPGQHEVLHA